MRKSVAHKTSQLSLPLLPQSSLTHHSHFTTHHPHRTFSLPHYPSSLHHQSIISPASSPDSAHHASTGSLTPTLPASSSQTDHPHAHVLKERRLPTTTVLLPFNCNRRYTAANSGSHGDGAHASHHSEKYFRKGATDSSRDFSKNSSTHCSHHSDSAQEHSQPVSSLILFNSRVSLDSADQLTAALSPHHPHIAGWRKARSRFHHMPSTLVHSHLSQSGSERAGVTAAMANRRCAGSGLAGDTEEGWRHGAALKLHKDANSNPEDVGKRGRRSDLPNSEADEQESYMYLPVSSNYQPHSGSHGCLPAVVMEGSGPHKEGGESRARGSSPGSSCHQQHHQQATEMAGIVLTLA